MTTLNAYASLADYKTWIQVRGGSTGTDAGDDAVIEQILKGVSRYIDIQTGRTFTPHVETRYFDTPDPESLDPRLLKLDADLLEVISITNGDGTAVPSTEYQFRSGDKPANRTPYTGIRMKGSSTYYWTLDSSGESRSVIAVLGIWAYHNDYTNAWLLGSTANEAMDASETGFDVTSNSLFAIGNIIRFDNELGYVSATGTNTLTTTRGANGSTAATHLTAINVYIWQTQEDIKEACLQIAQNVYGTRSGQSSAGKITVTAAGVVIRPEEVPALIQKLLESYRNVL